jgi:hypothetical protein
MIIPSLNVYAEECDSCKAKFDDLFAILEQERIGPNDLKKAWDISSYLYSQSYFDYIERVEGNKRYISASLTKTYSDICIKFGSDEGIDYYLKYMSLTRGSAEEERSFALERLFVKYPERVLIRIRNNTNLMDDLVWGFLNNRYYGAINPYEGRDYTAMTVYSKRPKPQLNDKNCRSIFFKTNPTLISKYNDYKEEIDYIINNSIKTLRDVQSY